MPHGGCDEVDGPRLARDGGAAELGMAARRLDRVERAEGDAEALEPRDEGLARERKEDLGNLGVKRRAVLRALAGAREALVAGELRALQHALAEGAPFALVLDRDDHRLALGRVGAIGGDR